MVEYCKDKINCRRKILLAVLGETFDRTQCGRMCDHCEHNSRIEIKFERQADDMPQPSIENLMRTNVKDGKKTTTSIEKGNTNKYSHKNDSHLAAPTKKILPLATSFRKPDPHVEKSL